MLPKPTRKEIDHRTIKIYKWKDGTGPAVSRQYNPNTIWGG
jgi:hypothetical protein